MATPRVSILQTALSSMDLNRSWGRASPLPVPTRHCSPQAPITGHDSSFRHTQQTVPPTNVTSIHRNVTPVNHLNPFTTGPNPDCPELINGPPGSRPAASMQAPAPMSHPNIPTTKSKTSLFTRQHIINEQAEDNVNEHSQTLQKQAKQKLAALNRLEVERGDTAIDDDVNWGALLDLMVSQNGIKGNTSQNMGGFFSRFRGKGQEMEHNSDSSANRGESTKKARKNDNSNKGKKKRRKSSSGTRRQSSSGKRRQSSGGKRRQSSGDISNVYDTLYDIYDLLRAVAWGVGRGGIPSKRKQYKTMQTVQVRVVFMRVQDVDTVNQQFDAEIMIQARWQEKQFAGMSEEDLANVEFHQCWNPEFMILNLEGALICEHGHFIIRYEAEHTYPVVTFMWHVAGTFREVLELEHFPLDAQELSIALTSARPSSEVELVEDYFHVSYLSTRAFMSGMWDPYSFVSFVRDYRMSQGLGAERHPVLIASCHCRRRIGYYMWNVFLIVFLIFLLSLIILAIDPTGTDRVGILLTLFLTTVAFKLVMARSLPSISYLTYLDIYIVFLMVYLAMQAFVDAFWCHLSKYRSREKIIFYDSIVQSVMVAVMIIGHLAFVVYIQTTAMARRRDLFKRDFEYQMGANRGRRFALDTNLADLVGTINRKKGQPSDMVLEGGIMRKDSKVKESSKRNSTNDLETDKKRGKSKSKDRPRKSVEDHSDLETDKKKGKSKPKNKQRQRVEEDSGSDISEVSPSPSPSLSRTPLSDGLVSDSENSS